MECVQRALNGGFGVETEAAAFVDELWGFGADDSFVEELLDLSNGFSETEQEEKMSNEAKPEETQKSLCNLQHRQTIEPENGFVPLPETELSVPVEEGLESLEWLSHFVEESFSDYSFPVKSFSENALATTREESFFTTPVQIQTKTRTKRARCGTRVWPVMSPSLMHKASSSPTSPSFKASNRLMPEKKVKKKAAAEGSVSGRRCCHCGVTKTPQWRAGPLGSKTLCNACGVRYKSGRLVPEYRPACSPTFSSELHSNNHRKVLEMRRKKEVEVELEMEVAASPRLVQS